MPVLRERNCVTACNRVTSTGPALTQIHVEKRAIDSGGGVAGRELAGWLAAGRVELSDLLLGGLNHFLVGKQAAWITSWSVSGERGAPGPVDLSAAAAVDVRCRRWG